jgi:DNA-binding transcriptional LysR family regulator
MSEPSPPPDLDLRLVRYFTVVAEHRHFGRAAEALRVAQPALSRQIRHLEQQLGARLLDRTPQGSRLTEAGEVFLPLARALLRSADQAAARTRAAAQPSRITIGYTIGLIVTPAVRQLRREQSDADVQTLHLDWNEPREALLDHRVDAVVTRLPIRSWLTVTLLGVALSGCDGLLAVKDPDIIDPADLDTFDGAVALYAGAVADFALAKDGGAGASGALGIVAAGDELLARLAARADESRLGPVRPIAGLY